MSILDDACVNGHTEIVRMILDLPLDRGVDPADHDNLPLQYACDNGHTEVARILLDLPEDRGVEPSYDDSCVLRNACEHGHTEIVRLLLDLPLGLTDARGLDEYIRTEMLINACENGNTEVYSSNIVIRWCSILNGHFNSRAASRTLTLCVYYLSKE